MSEEKHGIPKFNGGDDYSFWRSRVKFFFEEKHLWKYIERDVPEEPNSHWREKNKTVIRRLSSLLGNEKLHYLEEPGVYAKNVIQNLDEIYGRISRATQASTLKKLHHLKMDEKETMREFFSRFENLLRDLKAAGGNFSEVNKIAWLTGDLPTAYIGVMDAIESLPDENYTFAYIKSKLL